MSESLASIKKSGSPSFANYKVHFLPFLILDKMQGECTMTYVIPCRNRPKQFQS